MIKYLITAIVLISANAGLLTWYFKFKCIPRSFIAEWGNRKFKEGEKAAAQKKDKEIEELKKDHYEELFRQEYKSESSLKQAENKIDELEMKFKNMKNEIRKFETTKEIFKDFIEQLDKEYKEVTNFFNIKAGKIHKINYVSQKIESMKQNIEGVIYINDDKND